MLIDAAKTALWGMAFLVHCIILLILIAESGWFPLDVVEPWKKRSPWVYEIREYSYAVVSQAASILAQLKEPEKSVDFSPWNNTQPKPDPTLEEDDINDTLHKQRLEMQQLEEEIFRADKKPPSTETVEEFANKAARLLRLRSQIAEEEHKRKQKQEREKWDRTVKHIERNHEIFLENKKIVESCKECKLSYSDEGSFSWIYKTLTILSRRDAIASYRRWVSLWKFCKVILYIIAMFLTLALIRAKWLGPIPYIVFIVLFLPIAVALNIPYYAAVNHEVINLAHVWGSFPYIIIGGIVIFFVGWPPLFVILRKRSQSLGRMALAVCLPSSRALPRNAGDTWKPRH